MPSARKLAAAGLFILCLHALINTGLLPAPAEILSRAGERPPFTAESLPSESPPPIPTPESTPVLNAEAAGEEPDSCASEPLRQVMETIWEEEILETTIEGGLSIKNATDYEVNASELLSSRPALRLPKEGIQILIIHTHGSEAYTQAGLDHYEENDDHRTGDREFNIIRIGDELTEIFEAAGLRVLHDREIYDYPSYTGSYSRSGKAVEKYLELHPEISVVLDIHRDALGADGICYKTMAEEEGVCASQIMLLTGSDASGLYNPSWRENLSFALYLQNAVSSRHPSLMRPVLLVRERYNLHLTTGSLIIEVGSSGNTLREALAAIRLFGNAAAPALLELCE